MDIRPNKDWYTVHILYFISIKFKDALHNCHWLCITYLSYNGSTTGWPCMITNKNTVYVMYIIANIMVIIPSNHRLCITCHIFIIDKLPVTVPNKHWYTVHVLYSFVKYSDYSQLPYLIKIQITYYSWYIFYTS